MQPRRQYLGIRSRAAGNNELQARGSRKRNEVERHSRIGQASNSLTILKKVEKVSKLSQEG